MRYDLCYHNLKKERKKKDCYYNLSGGRFECAVAVDLVDPIHLAASDRRNYWSRLALDLGEGGPWSPASRGWRGQPQS